MPFLDNETWLFVTKAYKKKTSSQKMFIFWFQLLYPVVFFSFKESLKDLFASFFVSLVINFPFVAKSSLSLENPKNIILTLCLS